MGRKRRRRRRTEVGRARAQGRVAWTREGHVQTPEGMASRRQSCGSPLSPLPHSPNPPCSLMGRFYHHLLTGEAAAATWPNTHTIWVFLKPKPTLLTLCALCQCLFLTTLSGLTICELEAGPEQGRGQASPSSSGTLAWGPEEGCCVHFRPMSGLPLVPAGPGTVSLPSLR